MDDTLRPLSMSSLTVSPHLKAHREPPPRCRVLNGNFWDGYDSDTLFYDAILSDDGVVTLYAPKLLNLRPILEEALTESGLQGGIVFLGRQRHDLLRFRPARRSRVLDIRIGTTDLEVPLNPVDRERFRGLDVIYTMSKENNLTWVRDWLTWHQKVHGANGAIIVDTGSHSYSLEDLLETMASVPGYREVVVLRAPFKFGPALNTSTKVRDAAFLQPSLLNNIRDRFLTMARSMLNVDIDELVVGRDGVSIFDHVSRSLFGFTSFSGRWRYARKDSPDVLHSDHFFLRGSDEDCPTKYCLRPSSFIGRLPLQVHDVSWINRNIFRSRRQFYFLHMRQITTSWKLDRSLGNPAELQFDHETHELLRNCFPAGPDTERAPP